MKHLKIELNHSERNISSKRPREIINKYQFRCSPSARYNPGSSFDGKRFSNLNTQIRRDTAFLSRRTKRNTAHFIFAREICHSKLDIDFYKNLIHLAVLLGVNENLAMSFVKILFSLDGNRIK